MQTIMRKVKSAVRRLRSTPLEIAAGSPRAEVNNCCLTGLPSAQQAVDIFRGEWSSQFPGTLNAMTGGRCGLFEDSRMEWWLAQIGGAKGKSVLELGPLEAGHTYMLHQAGAESIVAVEANARAYLKCLIAKEIFELNRARFLCGDFLKYLRAPNCPQFDICVASGVLYHMRKPAELISLLAGHCTEHLLLWSHYYDADTIARLGLTGKFTESRPARFEGFSYTLHRYEYAARALGWNGFCGGTAPYTHWMTREDLFGCLEHFGFGDIRVGFDQPEHRNGPALALVARRK